MIFFFRLFESASTDNSEIFLQFPLFLHMIKTDLEICFGDVFREQSK